MTSALDEKKKSKEHSCKIEINSNEMVNFSSLPIFFFEKFIFLLFKRSLIPFAEFLIRLIYIYNTGYLELQIFLY